jgi:hypothetical protein
MAKELAPRVFAAHEASEVAHLVADHDPETMRTVALIPADEEAKPKPTRQLIDPDSLNLKTEDGEIVSGTSGGVEPTGKTSTTSSGKPRDPDASNPKIDPATDQCGGKIPGY